MDTIITIFLKKTCIIELFINHLHHFHLTSNVFIKDFIFDSSNIPLIIWNKRDAVTIKWDICRRSSKAKLFLAYNKNSSNAMKGKFYIHEIFRGLHVIRFFSYRFISISRMTSMHFLHFWCTFSFQMHLNASRIKCNQDWIVLLETRNVIELRPFRTS